MAQPQVTITLGRSGQKVVKEPWRESNGGRSNASAPSGSKRSLAESFGSDGDNLFSNNNKRMREDVGSRSYGYSNRIDNYCVAPRDLRLKLTRKRMSRQMEHENEKRKNTELHEKVSRAIRSLESPGHNTSLSSRGAAERGLMRSSYASRASNGSRQWSPERIPTPSAGISPMRPVNASRTECVLVNDPLESSRTNMPMLTNARRPLESGKLVPEPSARIGGMSLSPYQIDMVALKQMGDGDLKELGVPMGPRKKILQALQTRTKRPSIQAPRIMSL